MRPRMLRGLSGDGGGSWPDASCRPLCLLPPPGRRAQAEAVVTWTSHASLGEAANARAGRRFYFQINKDLEGSVSFLAQTGRFSVPLKCSTKKCSVSSEASLLTFSGRFWRGRGGGGACGPVCPRRGLRSG